MFEETLLQKLNNINQNYYKLILIITKDFQKINSLLVNFAEKNSIPYINLNLELSKRLIYVPFNERWIYADKELKNILLKKEHDTIIVDNTEILFEEHLKLNPIEELKNISKYKNIIASVRGNYKNNILTYAKIGEKEFKKYILDDLLNNLITV
ncbi:BREX-3 system P-loop-containing protein BrxF [Caloramator australicus]|uniref:VrlJ n=1 Tax=Caloramator australicus RC3 TaxID=857293 RepID=I7J5L2_9CLOT|nr:BREX-3 system P-loop-containing protein BrxF [Caloramator australicus]CCJ33842.1 VrlJ [Caloramator australicus RC3]